MKRTTSTLLTAALLCGAAVVRVDAQTPTGPNRQAFGTGELPEFLKPFDVTGPNGVPDGKLSIEERQAYERAMRDTKPPRPGMKNPWDADGDGILTDEEKQAARDAIAAKILTERTARFNELDTDSNGFLTATELQTIPHITAEQIATMIAHLDKPGTDGTTDGQISLAEFLAALPVVEPPLPRLPIPGAPVPPALKALDTNNDGILQLAEILAALDTNADGKVTLDEWRAYVLANPTLFPPPPDCTKQDPPPADQQVVPLPVPFAPVPSWLNALDTNKDHILQLSEILAAGDTNNDHILSPEEWAAYLLAHPELVQPLCGGGSGPGPGGMR